MVNTPDWTLNEFQLFQGRQWERVLRDPRRIRSGWIEQRSIHHISNRKRQFQATESTLPRRRLTGANHRYVRRPLETLSKMEKNIANIWLQDARGLVRAKVGDEAFFSYCQELESTSLRTPAASPIELTSSKSSTETAEHYDYFDPYLQTEALKGSTQDPTADPISICSEGSITQALEQLLTCKDVLETQTSWEVDHQKDELPLHQLPGWTQQDCSLMEDWQQNLSCSMSHLESESSSSLIGDTPNHGRQMITETPVGLFDPTTEDIFPPANHLSQSATVMSFLGDQILRRPSHIISSKVAAARRHRILLRQKSAPHQRGPSHSNGSGSSPRALKKMYVTKLAKELTCSNGQVTGVYISCTTMRFKDLFCDGSFCSWASVDE